MKKIAIAATAMLLALSLSGCSSNDKASEPSQEGAAQEQKAPLNIDGKWKQTNSESEDSWMAAEIDGNVITVDWVSDNGDARSVYWVGTYEQPETTEDAYDFVSVRDKEKTDTALLASTSDDKEFSYKGGVLSFELTAFGTTTTVHMEPEK